MAPLSRRTDPSTFAPLGRAAVLCLILAALPASACAAADAEPPAAPAASETSGGDAAPGERISLRNEGIAALENEQPQRAEEVFLRLAEKAPGDPLPWANLAIARLRQQKNDAALEAVRKALAVAPERGDVLAIQGEVLEWSGDSEAALEAFRQAAEARPTDPEILYTLYRQAGFLDRPEVAAGALDRLRTLRPENLVVLLETGKRAIASAQGNGEEDASPETLATARAEATAAYLRVRELLWQGDDAPRQVLVGVLEALEGSADPAEARIPATRLENVLKISPMYRESLRELATGIQGVPILRFVDEPASGPFGQPVPVRFVGERLSDTPTRGRALALSDLDGDGRPDLARLLDRGTAGDGAVHLEVRPASGAWAALEGPPPVAPGTELLSVDLSNDGPRDLLILGGAGETAGDGHAIAQLWRGREGDATFEPWPNAGLPGPGAAAAVAFDLDIEGDLDLVLAGVPEGAALRMVLNDLEGETPLSDTVSLQDAGAAPFPNPLPTAAREGVRSALASDLDRDGDLDLLVAGDQGVAWLDNQRQGQFLDRTEAGGLAGAGAVHRAVAADLDNDARPDLILAGPGGLRVFRSVAGAGQPPGSPAGPFEAWELPGLRGSGPLHDVVAFDADNDGRLDLATVGEAGVTVWVRDAAGRFAAAPLEGGPETATALGAADLDGDGDLDLVAAGPAGLHRFTNEGGSENGWLAVRLQGLVTGNSKNNLHGTGSTVEVFSGTGRQFREHDGEVSHFGLGSLEAAELLRVEWTNGVPQNRLAVEGNQEVVEEQLLKGSCPFLYVWTGEDESGEAEIAFVTDLLWGAPLGLPVAPGAWAGADPTELVRVDGARPRPDGRYDLRITEELWEAAYFDRVRLWVVDHPAEVEVASSLKVIPGRPVPDEIHGSRGLEPVARAWDGRGREVTERLANRDHVYADGYAPSAYQGVAREPWTLTFDLGEAPGAPIRLHLDGWIFPADASLNLAVAARGDLDPHPPRLEVETAEGWQPLLAQVGHPAGKTKTMVVDTPPLPPEVRRLRLVTGQWLAFDRIAWTTATADHEPRVIARLDPSTADLRYRGFSEPLRRSPNAPHEFDYHQLLTESPWRPFPGPYTRHGAVGELLTAADDRSVILAPGDELALTFDTAGLPPLAPGHRRTVFLESTGWDKDADRNTWAVQEGSLPLPRLGMTGYPPQDPAELEETEALRKYRQEWLTREWPGPGLPGPELPGPESSRREDG